MLPAINLFPRHRDGAVCHSIDTAGGAVAYPALDVFPALSLVALAAGAVALAGPLCSPAAVARRARQEVPA